eukprot:TRINITY_DN4247_c0_g1_i1.p1 TRINITY_DN4247_c0_g1~~TRINITY_DN4247_c0_g1_i1.p1  ORF type:complete len:748 (+),score=161.52 TRINITY_DN4247_c0_g1_i1:121-2364(+)
MLAASLPAASVLQAVSRPLLPDSIEQSLQQDVSSPAFGLSATAAAAIAASGQGHRAWSCRPLWLAPVLAQQGLRALQARRRAASSSRLPLSREAFSSAPATSSSSSSGSCRASMAAAATASAKQQRQSGLLGSTGLRTRLLRRFSGRRRWGQVLVVLGIVSAIGFQRAPAWASAMAARSGTELLLEASTLTERLANYRGICGSLLLDLSLSTVFFFLFAVCAGTETAITTLWPWKVRELAQRERDAQEQKDKEERQRKDDKDEKDLKRSRMTGPQRRKVVGKWTALREDIQRFMQTILIGATLSGVISTAFLTEICGQIFGPRGLAIATVSVSLVQLTLGEIIPKSMAVSSPYSFASATLPVFYRISFFVYPLSKILEEGLSMLLGVFGISVDTSKTPYVSEEELDLIFSSAMKSGIVDVEEGEMIRSVRNLDSKKTKEIMTPLVDMICIERTESLRKLYELILETQYSRIPVYNIRFDSIVGVVSMKTLMKHSSVFGGEGDKHILTVEELCEKPVFVPETMSLLNALRLLKERTLAICVDEYGGTTGLVTLEDVLEEIVGEIYDPDEEKDRVERAVNRSKIVEISPGRFSMSGVAEIDEVEERLSIEIPDGDFNSVGGFVCTVIDRIPVVGEVVTVETSRDSVSFQVTEVDDRRVLKIEAYREKSENASENRKSEESSDEELVSSSAHDGKETVLNVRFESPPTEEIVDAEDSGSSSAHDGKDAVLNIRFESPPAEEIADETPSSS